MIIFQYDKTFDGLLTCIFDAYDRKMFPDSLLAQNESLPLFYDDSYSVVTDVARSTRVWRALEKKLSPSALKSMTACWLADGYPNVDELMFRYIRKTIDAPISIELNFADKDVLELSRVYKQVAYERMRVVQFVRFQKAIDGIYFAAFEPVHNVIPLAVDHFRDRFADQKWVIYDMKRQYGYYYDLHEMRDITFTDRDSHLINGFLNDEKMAEDEKLFQQLWKTYFKAIAIKERYNPRKHRQDMPVRYWKYLTEKH